MIASLPLVSVGMPVFNAGHLIREAIEQVLQQTHQNLEIIISDNHSDDSTADICREFASMDNRIKYFRQATTIGATENFRFVLEQASGDYFMWAAHDDRRSANYVEILTQALIAEPSASIAFTNVAVFDESLNWRDAVPLPYNLNHRGTDCFYSRILSREYIKPAYLHIYGMLRKRSLDNYDWPSPEIGPDRPLIFFLSCFGPFITVGGACFYCFKPKKKKTKELRAASIYARKIRPFANLRLNLACTHSGILAERLNGRRRVAMLTFAAFALSDIVRKLQIRLLGLVHPFVAWWREKPILK